MRSAGKWLTLFLRTHAAFFVFVFTFAPMKAFQTYFCVKLQCILDLFCHLVKKLSILLDFNIFIFIFLGSVHAVRSCLPLLTKAISHFGIRGHWVKRGL